MLRDIQKHLQEFKQVDAEWEGRTHATEHGGKDKYTHGEIEDMLKQYDSSKQKINEIKQRRGLNSCDKSK